MATDAASSSTDRHTGVIGLAVMGENLALNIERNGFPISVFNRTAARTQEFMAQRAGGLNVHAAYELKDFVASLTRPRRIIVLVKAGAPVDAVLEEIGPMLEAGDIVVDGGNSFFRDTERRSAASQGGAYDFVGMGVSGGEEGALWGPSLMPGGPAAAYKILEPMLTAISAKSDFGACVTHVGPGAAGHYVKMVHNGIEYGDMQLIAETYDIMRRALGLGAAQIASIFDGWNQGKLSSYLIEITAQVLACKDIDTGKPLVDLVLDTAEQKGTGRWTSQSALDLGTPIPVIDAAVLARSMSSMKERRVAASPILAGAGPAETPPENAGKVLGDLENALFFAKISSYAQGMALLRAASDTYAWDLDLAETARIWTGGCIIRAKLLEPIMTAFKDSPKLDNLLLAPHITDSINETAGAARVAVSVASTHGIPCPALSAALNYVDAYRQEWLPANLIQGQRDFFGAHTYRRIDKPGVFHTDWTTGATIEIS